MATAKRRQDGGDNVEGNFATEIVIAKFDMIMWKLAFKLKNIGVFSDTVVLYSISDTIVLDCRRPW